MNWGSEFPFPICSYSLLVSMPGLNSPSQISNFYHKKKRQPKSFSNYVSHFWLRKGLLPKLRTASALWCAGGTVRPIRRGNCMLHWNEEQRHAGYKKETEAGVTTISENGEAVSLPLPSVCPLRVQEQEQQLLLPNSELYLGFLIQSKSGAGV